MKRPARNSINVEEQSEVNQAEIFIKVAPRHYERLRSRISDNSLAREPIERARRIDHSGEGMLLETYNISCDEKQARIILETAEEYCPEIAEDIEKAIKIWRAGC
jgi:hypothetical protein